MESRTEEVVMGNTEEKGIERKMGIRLGRAARTLNPDSARSDRGRSSHYGHWTGSGRRHDACLGVRKLEYRHQGRARRDLRLNAAWRAINVRWRQHHELITSIKSRVSYGGQKAFAPLEVISEHSLVISDCNRRLF